MSKSLSAFMRPNVAEIKNACFAPSPRFVGEDGKPVEWEIRCISADEYARIRSSCIRQVPVIGKKGQYTQQLDTYTFQARVAAACTMFPDLNDAALQDSWGVTKPEDLVGAMLIGGEFDDYITEVFKVNGFKDEPELVDEAKN
ncbi:phage tail assembly chaperone [Flintibacter muris]|uniref:phage tail assembly chaperone n=1 Tax=Flintibacter muris TaxID=2941327 RepID=UPI0020425378|nr:phage portal protein [Flintibacter muris]